MKDNVVPITLRLQAAVLTKVKESIAQAATTSPEQRQAEEREAERVLGSLYYFGLHVEQDHIEAVRWYRKAADHGDASAQFNLGVLYYRGDGVPQDHNEAAKLYRLAADQGNASAQFNLGVMYSKGEGVARDPQQAAKCYRMAAEQGDASAQVNLGVLYDSGDGVAQDYVQAQLWFTLADAKGDPQGTKNRAAVGRKMTQGQIAQAQRLARDWGRERAESRAACKAPPVA
jgi:TPR repeat protein